MYINHVNRINRYIMEDISFVTGELHVVQSREELESLLLEHPSCLTDCDLSNVDCSQINFDDYTIKNVVFSRYSNNSESKRTLSLLSFKRASLENVCFAQSELIRCNFDGAVLQRVDLFFSTLYYCRFRDAFGYCLDFRYSQIDSCSMSTATMVFCDFYMANFKGTTSFLQSHIMYSSLTSATFEGSCMTMDNLKSVVVPLEEKRPYCDELRSILAQQHKDVFLIQDDFKMYHRFYHIPNWNRGNPCGEFSYLNAQEEDEKPLESKEFIAKEAMHFYTNLSGLYSGKGLFRDSNRAYRMTKRKELESKWLSAKIAFSKGKIGAGLRKCVSCIGPLIVKALGYGYKWSVIVLWFILLVFGYSIYHFSVNETSYLSSLTGSINNSIGPYYDFIKQINNIIGSIEPTLGTLLIGFLGFVIANRIRNNS